MTRIFRDWRIGLAAALAGTVLVVGLVQLGFSPFGPADSPGGGDDPVEEWKLAYPETRRSDHVDDYHGRQTPDPYRWLEDPDSEETRAWIAAQNELTSAYLARLPQRDRFRQRLTRLWNYERFGIPVKRGERYFYTRNDGLQNQAPLYVVEGLDGEPRMLLDPNQLSKDGTVSLAGWRPSDDGELLAYGLAEAGSDWRTWRVLEVDTGRQLLDEVKWVKFSSVSWAKDGRGFFYSRFDEPKEGEEHTAVNFFQKMYFHELATPQFKDKLVYERPDQKEWSFDPHVTEDGRYLIISVWRSTENVTQIFYRDLANDGGEVIELIAGFDAEYEFIGNVEDTFFIATDLDAPQRRIVAVDLENPDVENWSTVIPQADEVVRGVSLVGGKLIVRYLADAHTKVFLFDLDGKRLSQVDLPDVGSAGGFGGRSDAEETFYYFSNFTTPTTIYRLDLQTRESSVFRQPHVEFDPNDYETKQVFVEQPGGVRTPIFITHKKGLEQDGDNPTLLYGYGGFDIPITPGFSPVNLVWLEAGGVYAVANLRGGGEYGREWHEAGMKENKQNVFNDFYAAAEWLIENGYTSRDKLAIQGRSNGGLLVGAAMTQRPELFACATPAVGVMDMLRYHKFTIGWAWAPEFGTSDNAQEFETLLKYSPLHNLEAGVEYPATLITTADHDDRVVPAHSFKFAAALQAAQAEGGPPVLIRIETDAGHGAGTPTRKRIEEASDILAFIAEALQANTAAVGR